jgi:hypothetical protein
MLPYQSWYRKTNFPCTYFRLQLCMQKGHHYHGYLSRQGLQAHHGRQLYRRLLWTGHYQDQGHRVVNRFRGSGFRGYCGGLVHLMGYPHFLGLLLQVQNWQYLPCHILVETVHCSTIFYFVLSLYIFARLLSSHPYPVVMAAAWEGGTGIVVVAAAGGAWIEKRSEMKRSSMKPRVETGSVIPQTSIVAVFLDWIQCWWTGPLLEERYHKPVLKLFLCVLPSDLCSTDQCR